jgi:polysaccharide export outer membrane protein
MPPAKMRPRDAGVVVSGDPAVVSQYFRLATRVATFFLCVGLLAGCASGGHAPSSLPDADPVAASVGRPEYRIGPSDLLAVTVFQVKDLDREVRVNNAGEVTLPLIGNVPAAGRTVHEFEAQVAAKFQERFLQDPQVTVFVKEFASQRVTVGGSVDKPGIFPITSRMTLLQSIALAGGLDEVASKHNVFVFRTAGGQRVFARFDVAQIEAGAMPDPELSGEDVVVVDTAGGKVALYNLIKLAPFVAVWRAYR